VRQAVCRLSYLGRMKVAVQCGLQCEAVGSG
jgi:hypothetical protein